jgi:hypothetical protein
MADQLLTAEEKSQQATVDSSKPSIFNRFSALAKAASGVSIFTGVVAAIFGMFNAVESMQSTARSLKLSGLGQVNQYIDQDNKVRPEINTFLASFDNEAGKEKLRQLVQRYGTGENAYNSNELTELRDIGRHYERMGLLVKFGYLDFDLIYEVVPFPDNFWNETSEFRETVQKHNWSGHKGLPDFWKNFSYLQERYIERRLRDQREGHRSAP